MDFLWMLEGIRNPFLDQFMQIVTYFGQEVLVIGIICLLYWCIDKRFAYQLGFTYFTAGLCVQALKITFRIPRPWILDPNFKAVESAVEAATGYSFPSGHTMGAAALFTPLALRAKKPWLKALCVGAFLLIGFSRMYLGCHTPKDVLTSIVISVFFSLLVWRCQTFLLDDTRYMKPIALALMLISILTAGYALYMHYSGIIEAHYAEDCCKTAGAGMGFAIGWYLERTKLQFSTQTRNLWSQAVKLLLGLAGALVLKFIISLLLGDSILANMAEYFILVLWVLFIYPCCFCKFAKEDA